MAKKTTAAFLLIFSYATFLVLLSSCASSKRGCPTNSANMGAEKVLGGEKPDKKSKFKIKGMG
ncbi:MAG: hypothetical protein V4722_00420 [Bacteroidota bacterium]